MSKIIITGGLGGIGLDIVKFFSIYFLLSILQFSLVEANDFNNWIIEFKKKAVKEGISLQTTNI